jgi:hypothetical protein
MDWPDRNEFSDDLNQWANLEIMIGSSAFQLQILIPQMVSIHDVSLTQHPRMSE